MPQSVLESLIEADYPREGSVRSPIPLGIVQPRIKKFVARE
jgi:hypothetical protein